MVEGIQYGGGISSIRQKILSTDVSHDQYGRGASSAQLRALTQGKKVKSLQPRAVPVRTILLPIL